jgi:hypothetical protein
MASPMNTAPETGGSGVKKGGQIDDMLLRLGIEEDEFDDFIYEGEAGAPAEGMKWMALAKVHTANPFSPQAFEHNMRTAWSPAKEIKFNHLEDNLFTVQCSCLGDWLKVEKGGPWLFRQSVVSIEQYDGFSLPETVDLNFFTTWIQIHKLPVGYRQEPTIKNMTDKKVGKVVETQLNVKGAGNFVRAKVRLDVRKPLARFVSIIREGAREVYPIKFEKMPRFCGACGLVGHSHLECGTGEFDEEKLRWGDFLKADWDTWFGRGVGGGRGVFSGRGMGEASGRGRMGGRDGFGGRGEGTNASWRFNALAYVDGVASSGMNQKESGTNVNTKESDVDDTASSPGKKDMEVDKRELANAFAKRSLEMGKDGLETEGNPLDVDSGNGAAAANTGGSATDGGAAKDGKKDRAKRTKKGGANSSSLGSAGSHEDPVRSQ